MCLLLCRGFENISAEDQPASSLSSQGGDSGFAERGAVDALPHCRTCGSGRRASLVEHFGVAR